MALSGLLTRNVVFLRAGYPCVRSASAVASPSAVKAQLFQRSDMRFRSSANAVSISKRPVRRVRDEEAVSPREMLRTCQSASLKTATMSEPADLGRSRSIAGEAPMPQRCDRGADRVGQVFQCEKFWHVVNQPSFTWWRLRYGVLW